MNNEVSPANQVGKEEASSITDEITELSEDMEMVSPGTMLRDARKKLSLSQDHIASKLNFKVGIVINIEEDIFDPLMPVTFNRGYLANYAKLVGVEVEDVLASYDAVNAATTQRSEMLSFSKETSKQAEHSRVMWLSYLIVAVLVGLTILWWLQESKQQASELSSATPSTEVELNKVDDDVVVNSTEPIVLSKEQVVADKPIQTPEKTSEVDAELAITAKQVTGDVINNNDSNITPSTDNSINDVTQPVVTLMSTAIFTFKGDCWVNIFDATGERIAWGVKKSGYVMTIQGEAPLRITVGKPELTSIVFNDQPVDMSIFSVGNIAKFNLPIVE